MREQRKQTSSVTGSQNWQRSITLTQAEKDLATRALKKDAAERTPTEQRVVQKAQLVIRQKKQQERQQAQLQKLETAMQKGAENAKKFENLKQRVTALQQSKRDKNSSTNIASTVVSAQSKQESRSFMTVYKEKGFIAAILFILGLDSPAEVTAIPPAAAPAPALPAQTYVTASPDVLLDDAELNRRFAQLEKEFAEDASLEAELKATLEGAPDESALPAEATPEEREELDRLEIKELEEALRAQENGSDSSADQEDQSGQAPSAPGMST